MNPTNEAVHMSLEAFKDIDQLVVIMESSYKIVSDRFQYWQMAHPTKNFTFVVTHPPDCKLQKNKGDGSIFDRKPIITSYEK